MSNLTQKLIPSLDRLEWLASDLEDGAHMIGALVAHFRNVAASEHAKINNTKLAASGLFVYAGVCEFRSKELLKELEEFRDMYSQQDLLAFDKQFQERLNLGANDEEEVKEDVSPVEAIRRAYADLKFPAKK